MPELDSTAKKDTDTDTEIKIHQTAHSVQSQPINRYIIDNWQFLRKDSCDSKLNIQYCFNQS